MQNRLKITETQWRDEARPWGKLFVSCYGAEEVTPYIHVFVYHFGFYMET